MPSPVVETLLILQDRDSKRLGVEANLKAVPRDIAAVEAKIGAEKAAIETAKQELKELETKKKLLETEIGSTETKLAKYKTQQSLVKKNDEYQALGLEIEHTEKAIGDLEGQELEVMYQIDEAKKKFAAAEAVLKANISGHESRIKVLKERDLNLAAELKTAQADVAAARTRVGVPQLRQYDRIAARQMPVIVPIVHGDKCGGCHLKVSGEIISAARSKSNEPLAALPTCEQCGRIVYWE